MTSLCPGRPGWPLALLALLAPTAPALSQEAPAPAPPAPAPPPAEETGDAPPPVAAESAALQGGRTFTPEDGSKVGVGMPFSVRFSRGITNPEDVEKAIRITTEPAVDVEGHWFGNDRLDFRPEKYWKPGTKVTVDLNLDGVEGRSGVYGEQDKTVKFTIGRNQVSVVDAKKLTMKVMQDGKTIKTIPVTTGQPGMETWNGQMVISEMLTVTRMNGETVGYGGEYDIKDVPHAVRLTTSGTFLHGNYWASGAFGNYNASHGCIGLRDVRGGWDKKVAAAWFFNHSMVGDVVVVKNSEDRTVDPDNGLNGWNMSWEKWKK